MRQVFGPWITHNGQPAPHLVGKLVEVENEFATGKRYRTYACPVDGHGGSWTWEQGHARTLRYRVKRPLALQHLVEIAEGTREVVA